jgi:outer membrane protein OmpA-like peptidoglycan-associated protein
MGPLPGGDIDAVAALGMPRPAPVAVTPPLEVQAKAAAAKAAREEALELAQPPKKPEEKKPAQTAEPANAAGDAAAGAKEEAKAAGGEAHLPREAVPAREVLASSSVFFDVDKFELTAEGKAEIARAVSAIPEGVRLFLVVGGHTDEVGTDAYNMGLSRRRADSVARFLIELGKVPAENIKAEGFGESKPVTENETPEGRAKNRRVVIEIAPEAK